MTDVDAYVPPAFQGVDLAIVPYDESAHRDFVMGTFIPMVLSTWPWSHVPMRVLEQRFLRELRSPESRALVAAPAQDPTALIGWMVTRPHANEIVAGYVLRRCRRRWGVGTRLAVAGGIATAQPVGVWFWTYACERIALAHPALRLFHKVTDERAA